MKGKSTWLMLSVSALIFAVGGYFWLSPKQTEAVKKAMPVLNLAVQPVQKELHYFEIESQSLVQPTVISHLAVEVAGSVQQVSLREGDFVRAGEVLLVINPLAYQAKLAAAKANLAAKRLAYLEAKATHEAAIEEHKHNHEKATPLGLKLPHFELAQAQLHAAEKTLNHAKYELKATKVIAPFDGLIMKLAVDQSEFVEAGEVLFELASLENAQVRLPVTQKELALLKIGHGTLVEPLQARLQWQNGSVVSTLSASVKKTLSAVSEDTQQTYLVIDIPTPYLFQQNDSVVSGVPFGQFVNATVRANEPYEVVKLPAKLLKRNQSVVTVAKNRLQITDVTVLHKDAETVFISDGLASEQWVSSVRVANPVPGTEVNLTNLAEVQSANAKSIRRQAL